MKRAAPLKGQQLTLLFDQPPPGPPARPSPPAAPGTRRLALGTFAVDYTLRRARRRSIGFTVDDRGLTVAAPRWVSLAEIEAAIAEKQRWIHRKLAEYRDWRARQPVHGASFVDGGTVPLLGRPLTLRLRPAARCTDRAGEAELHLALPASAGEAQVRDAVLSWLQAEARRVLGSRLQLLAARQQVQPRSWSLSSARTQWGTCTHDGHIRLNWRLVHFPLPVIDYVVAHELAHLQEMNHGPSFWRAVGRLLPGFEAARDEVRKLDLAALPI
ncbi:MAG: M48 family metallopeptidase [Burkholderiales bacterium]|nr:MAG: M48 family metallopeptidase [Burkholderiales bacterium]